METRVIERTPIGNRKRRYRQDKFVISTFNAQTEHIRRGLELCKELEFNMVEFGWVNPEDSIKCMNACEEIGLEGVFQNWEAFGGFQAAKGENKVNFEKLSEYLEHTKKYRHVAGYYVWDEPLEEEKIRAAAEQVCLMELLDPERLPFTVAIPSYNTEKTWANGRFEGYLRTYAEEIEPAVLSLDYYPFWGKEETEAQLDSSELFLDIGLLRKIALEKDIPMWFYFQTQDDPGFYGYQDFAPEKVRMQQYNALLHGAKGLQNYNVFNGAVNRENSTPGPLFAFTKDLNHRCHQLGKTLMALKSTYVFHSPEVLKGNPNFEAFRQPIGKSAVLDMEELPFRCSVGEFKDKEKNSYLFVQNRDLYEERSFDLKLKQVYRIYEVSQEDGIQRIWEAAAETVSVCLKPGDGILLRFQDERETPYLIEYALVK